MRKELQDLLVQKYPTVFKDYGGDYRKTCMAWGISVGDGWFDLLDRLCAKLEPMGVVAQQVKEKFGSLRFYYTGPKLAYDFIEEAEAESAKTCETCGNDGELCIGGFWLKTLCFDCRPDGYRPYKEVEDEI